MDSIKSKLKFCIECLTSGKVSDGKKGVDELKNLLDRDDVIEALNVFSEDFEETCTWNALFTASHHALLKKIDKARESKAKTAARENTKLAFSSVVSLLVKKANADYPYIRCNAIIDATIYVLNTPFYYNTVGDMYLNILYVHVLPVPTYWGNISLDNWKALFELGVNLFENETPHCKMTNVIAVIELIIKYGCEHSSLLSAIKKRIFGFLKNLVQKSVTENVDFQKHVFKLLVTACEQLKKECRMAVCKFSEDIFEKLLNMCQTKVQGAADKKQYLIDFLLIAMECHHPNGVSKDSDKAFACDMNGWIYKLQRLMYFANAELEYLGMHSSRTHVLPTPFIKLVVEVYNQIFREGKNFLDVTVNQSINESYLGSDRSVGTKRRRITCRFSDIIERLKTCDRPIDMWPWLSVLASLVSAYPDLVQESEYFLLLQSISKFLLSSKEPVVTDYLCQCCISLIDLRQSGTIEVNQLQDEESLWNSIWNIVLRTIGLNQNIEWSHKLLQNMMKHIWKPERGNSVLKLYLSHVVRQSEHSLMTLYYLRLHIAFPSSFPDIPVSLMLLQWLLPDISNSSFRDYYITKMPVKYMAHMLMLLCLKNNVKKLAECAEKSLDYVESRRISTAQIHGLISYNSEIFLTCFERKEPNEPGDNNKACVLNEYTFDHFLTTLEDHTSSLMEICKTVVNPIVKIQYLSSGSLLLIHVLKFELYYECNAITTRLVTELDKIYSEFLNEVDKLFLELSDIKKMIELLIVMSSFLKELWSVPMDLVEELSEKLFPTLQPVVNFIDNIRLLREQKYETKKKTLTAEGLLCLETLSDCDRLRLEACRVLAYYSFNHGPINETQYRVIDHLLDKVITAFENESGRDLIIISIFSLQAVFSLQNLNSDLFFKASVILKNICQNDYSKWIKIEESCVILLQFTREAIRAAHRLGDQSEWNDLVAVLEGVQSTQDKCGVVVATEIVWCWGAFLEINLATANNFSFEWIDFVLRCGSSIFENLRSPFNEVRLTAVSFVYKIFSLIDQFSSTEILQCLEKSDCVKLLELVDQMVDSFETVLSELFIVGELDLIHDEKDEEFNRPIIVFYALASAICSSMKYRRRLISLFFQLTREKRLKQIVASKILNLIKSHFGLKNLDEFLNDNIHYILSNWFEKYKSFEDFPFKVIECSSLKEFYQKYLAEITVMYLFYNDIEMLTELEDISEKSVKDILVENFAEVTAIIIYKKCTSQGTNFSGTPTARTIYNFVLILTEEGFNDMLSTRYPNLLINIFSNFQDPSYQVPKFSILPMSSPLAFSLQSVEDILKHLEENTGIENMFLYAAENETIVIPKIFKFFYTKVMKAATPEVRLECLQQYILFSNRLIPHYEALSKYNMTVFISFIIVRNILNFLSLTKSQEPFLKACLNFFYDFLSEWLPDDFDRTLIIAVFSECLSSIVEKVIVLISKHKKIADLSFRVLEYLLIKRCTFFLDSLNALHRFPEEPEYDRLRIGIIELQDTEVNGNSLVNEIKLFLTASESSPHSSRCFESLKYLQKQLSTYREELIPLFKKNPDKQLLSEDYVKTIPHRLICTLIKQAGSEDDNVRLEAINCLSEIGLVDLHTLVLQSDQNQEEGISNPENLLAENVIFTLKENLTNENVDVAEASFRILYCIFRSEEGWQFIQTKMKKSDRTILYPFIPKRSENNKWCGVWKGFSIENFEMAVDNENLWSPTDDTTFNTWIGNLVKALCSSFSESCFVHMLQTICQHKASVAVKIFKYLVNLLTTCERRKAIRIMGRRINQFLEKCLALTATENYPDSYTSANSDNKDCYVFNDKASVQCFLDVVDFIRLNQTGPDVNDMNLNYLLVAKAALHCSAYFTAILYAELHVNSLIISKSDIQYDGNIISYLEDLGNKYGENHDEILNLLREAFSKIGDTDALYGCGSPLLLNTQSRILHYQQVENWQRVFESCETSLATNASQPSRIKEFTSAIGNSGYNYLKNQYIASLEQSTPQLRDAQFECAWKLDKWDLIEPSDDEKTFSYYHYAALKDLQQKNYKGVRVNVNYAKASLIPSVTHICLESTKNIYHVMTKLQCLQDIETAASYINITEVIGKWKTQDTLSKGLNFSHKEMILNQRVRLVDQRNEEAQNFILDVAKKARKEHNFNFADTCLALVKRADCDMYNVFNRKVRFEEACVLWKRNETYIARLMMKDLIKTEEKTKTNLNCFHSILLKTYGTWLSEINLESADIILDEYLLKSLDGVVNFSVETNKARKIRLKTYKQVAEFADQQYQQICEYIKSDTFEELSKNVDESKKMADAILGENKDKQKSKLYVRNQSKVGASEVLEIRNKEQRYLDLALEYYLKILAESDEDNLKVFRVTSFWLHQKTNAKLHFLLKRYLHQIPSHKFIPVLPQIMAHITRNTAECFGNMLNGLVEKCAKEHPHHTLPLIFSLANYTRDDEYIKGNQKSDYINLKRGNHPKVDNKKTNEDRVAAASNMIKQLKTLPNLNKIIIEMENLYEAYIQVAYWTNKETKIGQSAFPPDKLISKISDYINCYCPTIEVPINKQGDYKNVIGIRKIDKKFVIFTGINQPKKITCMCTDGETRDQFIKGEDDLRVDAVMQQVFGIMNKLLMENKHTSKRELLLRTYKVVPLSQRSGVLEFCINTISLNEYLIGTKRKPGAHKRFRPNDLEIESARSQVKAAQNCEEKSKRKVFLNICSKLKPVFRYFFLEKFRLPAMWFERKLAYIHSVAATSVVGYILGIGDRHGQNILIDTKTAELIHIDFGIAFEIGLNLSCAEHVPFRLTRDIEDGMGILSIDGIFRKCCEQVMAVLRQNSEIIRTTSEVFIYDPMYIWTVGDEGKASGQDGVTLINNDPAINVSASRALSRLKLKLQGMEDGTPTNVEGQVNRLIQQAKDVNNLCRLFHGWQAYL